MSKVVETAADLNVIYYCQSTAAAAAAERPFDSMIASSWRWKKFAIGT